MKMKKVLYVIATGLMALSLSVGCGKSESPKQAIHIAALNGPTGMGMAKMMKDGSKDYEISLYQSPDELTGKIISGDLDIACVPSNLAAVLYQKTEKNIDLLGMNTLGVLYIVEKGDTINNIEDLRGTTILASGQGSTPEYVLNELLSDAGMTPGSDVTIDYLGNHTEVVNKLLAGEGSIALLPEPHVSIAESKDSSVRTALDLNEAWKSKEGTDLPMGVIIARKDYVDANEGAVKAFLKDYETSVKYVNEHQEEAGQMMVEAGLFENAELAARAISSSHIVFEDGKAAQADLETFYKILEKVNPKSIGGNLPDEAFYYGN